ncbi:MAG: TlpA family protein disulfide reductase [Zoogloeaceae bacterium]|jgi:peroxiredoxin|nr:TlpA family protein disulfide reductase [Zoogloeaceae bacterium]
MPSRFLVLLAALCLACSVRAEVANGQTVPPFETRLLDGKTVSAQALKGKTVLVVFWATWCPICQRELPVLEALYARYRDKGFEILALSVDADAFTLEEFWKDHDYSFPVAMRAEAHAQIFNPGKAIPSLYLIDRKGVLRFSHVGELKEDVLKAQLLPLL